MQQKAVEKKVEIIYIKILKLFWEKHWFEKHKEAGKIKGPNLKNVPVKCI